MSFRRPKSVTPRRLRCIRCRLLTGPSLIVCILTASTLLAQTPRNLPLPEVAAPDAAAVIPSTPGALTASGSPATPDSNAGPARNVVAASVSELSEIQLTTLDSVTGFLKTYCVDCHGSEHPEAQLDLSEVWTSQQIAARHQIWQEVIHRLEAGEMPPADHPTRPSPQQSDQLIREVRGILVAEARRNAGDPGVVPLRRLSNAEYNYTIRDLTGVDIRPTREFPVDPANTAGFDNSAESLTLSPALMNKYLTAARQVSQHLVLQPEGFEFAPHPVMTETDRDKFCVNRIVEFYAQQPTSLSDYFLAAWQLRTLSEQAIDQLPAIAANRNVSSRYLHTVWQVLTDHQDNLGPLKTLRTQWLAIPIDADEQQARTACDHIADFVKAVRHRLEPPVEGLRVNGIHNGAQAFVLWKNDQYAANRRRFHAAATIDHPEVDHPDVDESEVDESEVDESEVADTPEDQALRLPVDGQQRQLYWQALRRFADVFPDTFYVAERGRDYVGVPREKQEKGRLLSAGFHSMMGYYRDDAPLCDLILDDAERAQLDQLWRELDFVTSAPMRQYQGFVWFERTDSAWMRDPEFDFARAEDHNVTSEPMIERLSQVYLQKARRNGATGIAEAAIVDYFDRMNRSIRWVERARIAAEPSHLAALQQFAARCCRRPLTDGEARELREFYTALRTEDQLTHEEAIQDAIVSLLISPRFFYRTDLSSARTEAIATSRPTPLSSEQLASRLSYFLWSSMPDPQLLDVAASGRLQEPDILLRESRRMLQDARSRALAVEFAGNWLGFRRFEEHNSVDRERFPEFTDELRSAMFEEPIRFLLDLIQHDGSVLQCLWADHVIVNQMLARHYNLDWPPSSGDPGPDGWARIENAQSISRGGLIPMAVFLTQNSPGLRTSPVKRGYWVVRTLLGEHIPAPPPNVPDLPEDEAALGDVSLAAVLAKHRDHAACAGCHDRFDSVGLIFERFGPVGELRTMDLGGRPVSTQAVFPDGSEGSTPDDLRRYLKEHREDDFVDTLCRKLLTFALGRSLLLSDELLVDEMKLRVDTDDGRFSSLIETIVTSPQFRTHR